MFGFREYVEKYRVALFFILAVGISWACWLPVLFFVDPEQTSQLYLIPGGFGPLLAAAVMLWIRGENLRLWARRIVDWRVSRKWYAVAFLLPIFLIGVTTAVIAATGEESFAPGMIPASLVSYPLVVVLITLVGGGNEEPGWRGYALPHLQARYNALVASVIIGAVWAVWHLPMFVFEGGNQYGTPFAIYFVDVVGMSIVLTWLYNSTRGSVLLAMILHGGINASMSLIPVSDPAIRTVLLGHLLGVWSIAVIVLVRYGPTTLAAVNEDSLSKPPGAGHETSLN